MMLQEALYLDTSVVSVYFDSRDPSLQDTTHEFWGQLGRFRPYVSTLVFQEVMATPDEVRREEMLSLLDPVEVFGITPEMRALSEEYQRQGAFTPNHGRDALHAAAASVFGVDYLVSWNFRHLVRVQTRRLVGLINLQRGYRALEIVAPGELL